jgi:hypothetical protein
LKHDQLMSERSILRTIVADHRGRRYVIPLPDQTDEVFGTHRREAGPIRFASPSGRQCVALRVAANAIVRFHPVALKHIVVDSYSIYCSLRRKCFPIGAGHRNEPSHSVQNQPRLFGRATCLIAPASH